MRVKQFISLVILFSSASALAAADRMVTVNGTCLRRITPDRASVTITAEVKDPEPKKASQKAQEIYERVLERVKKLKLPDSEIQTTEYSVNEIREWENNKNVLRGFRARMGFRVETSDAKRIGEALDIASKEGVKDIGSLSLFVSPSKDREEKNACLKEAAEQARIKATKLAETLGARLGEALLIAESGVNVTPPQPRFAASMRGASEDAALMAAPTVEAGKEELSMTVQVSFGLK